MGEIDKLTEKFLRAPKDSTWEELVKILAHFGLMELSKKGRTGDSRRKFADTEKRIVNLHKPHPGNIVKQYAIKQIIEKLKSWQII
ncbi:MULTISPECIES: type II toxin-antitoxin system HicA family toxin [Flavobacteriaceae]|uniref:type II toxin-antitoxin system HicA family toxin n=1 Tax=Flavobacteriaceae TaxID=49546 RepID=UPI0014915153|nr:MULTISPECIES: type II toxin-antitoxin system HicA family toxin [Allomuricauda]MDC6367225.1 type II toxin-antitoxin system HicA family toxin [Muricauda sp. AC10]